MQVAKEKMKDMASKRKEIKEVQNAKSEEKTEKKAAGSREEKEIAQELSKARQAEAKMEYHLERAEHRADTLAHHAAGTNSVLTHSAMAGGGDGTFYNAQGQPFGGMPARPGGGAVNAVRLPARPQGDVAVNTMCPPAPGIGNAASMEGGMPARPPGGVTVDAVRPPDGAIYPSGKGNGASIHGPVVGKNYV